MESARYVYMYIRWRAQRTRGNRTPESRASSSRHEGAEIPSDCLALRNSPVFEFVIDLCADRLQESKSGMRPSLPFRSLRARGENRTQKPFRAVREVSTFGILRIPRDARKSLLRPSAVLIIPFVAPPRLGINKQSDAGRRRWRKAGLERGGRGQQWGPPELVNSLCAAAAAAAACAN